MNRSYIAAFVALIGSIALASLPLAAFANTSVSIEALSPASTVSIGTDVTFTVSTIGFSSPSFSISDSFPGSTISNGDIVSSVDSNGNGVGAFSWTPTTADVGLHVITISISDAAGDTGVATETITVANGPTISITSVNPGYSLAIGTPLTATIVATGFTNPVYTVEDSINGTSLSSGDIGSSGYFSWTPTNADIGDQTITFTVVDSYGHSASLSQQVTVKNPYVSVESLEPGQNVPAGTTVTFQIVPSGFTNPSYSLTDSFIGSTLSSADISSSGDVSWTPAASDEGAHTISVAANDNDDHNATDTISVYVEPGSGVASTGAVSSVTTPTNSFTSYLQFGSTASEVTQLQTLLAKLGYLSVSPTGYFGAVTKAAVEKFQSDHGLALVGATGPQTRALLNQLSTTGATNTASTTGTVSAAPTVSAPPKPSYLFSTELSVGSQGPAVTALQNRLTAEGVYSGSVTGYFGSATKAAVEKYQTKHDLSAVGVLGPETRAYLNEGI